VSAQESPGRPPHLDLPANLVNREIRDPAPSSAVVFLGPRARFDDKMPPELLVPAQAAGPHFFYLQYWPLWPSRVLAGNSQTVWASKSGGDQPDTISRVVRSLKGTTIAIYTPRDFDRAIEQVVKRAGGD
jgi:hypothetical protein